MGRVLIVDDNADLVSSLKSVLEGAGAPEARFSVTTASNGKQAIGIASREGFDVAIVDVKLPDTIGVDLIAPLRERSPFSEVVLITGFASVDAAIAALRSGAFAFVLKSFRPEELISTVEQAMTKVQLRRERDELEHRYRALVELTDVIVVALDDKNEVRLFNPKACGLTRVSAEQARGEPFVDSWIPVADASKFRDAIAHARTTGAAREVETGFAEPRRRVRWHLSSAPDGKMVYGIGIDVTERRALEKRAADAEALSAMGTLAMNLAHEIRNPLNAAVLQLNLLGRQVDKLEADAETRAALHKRAEIVGDEVGRLSRLLTEFLELARPRGIAREPVHVGTLVNDVLDLELDTATQRGIAVERELAADGCVAIGDREKLKQVVINLVLNAIEAMKNGGTLTARVACCIDNVAIVIEDTGIGIAPEHISNVFDPFFTTKEGGTGLGLSIVRKIVDQHAGAVHLESVRGGGTRVEVYIPIGR
jgi:PAS domain S-box-containing protein